MMPETKLTVIGSMPTGWDVRQLGSVLAKRVRPVSVTPSETYREIGIRSHGKGIFHKDPVKGVELGDKRVFWVEPNCLTFNIVFAWEGAVAVTRPNEDGMIASHRFPMFSARDEHQIDIEYLRRFFQTPLGVRLLGEASPGGAGRNRTLNQKFLGEVPVPVPPVGEQRKIAAILSSVDDAIAATQAVIDQLQVVKKAMMAELLTRGQPGRHTRFKQTEIGEVPEEWDVVEGEHLFTLSGGYGPSDVIFSPSGVALFLKVDDFNRVGNERHIVGAALRFNPVQNSRIRLYSDGHLVFPKRGAAIFKNRVRLLKCSATVDPNLMVLEPNSRIDAGFFALQMLQIGLYNLSDNSGIPQINNKHLYPHLFVVPPMAEQLQIRDALTALDERIEADTVTLVGQGVLKSALMSVLLTGDVRVTPDEAAA